MKIAFGLADVGACGFYRCVVPGLELRRRGHDVRFHLMAERTNFTPHELQNGGAERPEYVRPFEAVDKAEIFVGQRVSDPRIAYLMADFRLKGGIVIADTDDNLNETPPGNPVSKHFGNGKTATKTFESSLKVANLTTVSTENLLRRYEQFGPAFVMENALDPNDFAAYAPVYEGDTKREGQLRIGWFGSQTHRGDLAVVIKPLAKIMREREDVRFVLFGDDVRGFFPGDVRVRVEYHAPVSFSDRAKAGTDRGAATHENLRTFYNALRDLDLDVGIAPLVRSVFNGGKSFVKVLEYGMLGIPVIASRVGPYAEYEKRGGIILTANDEEWLKTLRVLADGKDGALTRRSLAKLHRFHIGTHHLIDSRIEAYEARLNELLPVPA